jgi:hypothetical protein
VQHANPVVVIAGKRLRERGVFGRFARPALDDRALLCDHLGVTAFCFNGLLLT